MKRAAPEQKTTHKQRTPPEVNLPRHTTEPHIKYRPPLTQAARLTIEKRNLIKPVFFKSEQGASHHFKLHIQSVNWRGDAVAPTTQTRLKCRILYEDNHEEAKPKEQPELLNIIETPMYLDETGKYIIKCRIEEVSKKHRITAENDNESPTKCSRVDKERVPVETNNENNNKSSKKEGPPRKFIIEVSVDTQNERDPYMGPAIRPVLTDGIEVRSKVSKENKIKRAQKALERQQAEAPNLSLVGGMVAPSADFFHNVIMRLERVEAGLAHMKGLTRVGPKMLGSLVDDLMPSVSNLREQFKMLEMPPQNPLPQNNYDNGNDDNGNVNHIIDNGIAEVKLAAPTSPAAPAPLPETGDILLDDDDMDVNLIDIEANGGVPKTLEIVPLPCSDALPESAAAGAQAQAQAQAQPQPQAQAQRQDIPHLVQLQPELHYQPTPQQFAQQLGQYMPYMANLSLSQAQGLAHEPLPSRGTLLGPGAIRDNSLYSDTLRVIGGSIPLGLGPGPLQDHSLGSLVGDIYCA